MNNKIKEILEVTVQEPAAVNTFIQILELPDSQFNVAYPELKKNIADSLSEESVRTEIRNQLKSVPVIDLEKEMAGINQFIEDIKNDDTLSERKKDLLISIITLTKDLTISVIENPRERVKVKIQKISKDAILPTYAHKTDAGADIYAIEDVTLRPHSTELIKTGIKIAVPVGYEVQIRPRSGMSLKTSIRIANAPGTIDSEYRGEVGIIAENTGNLSYTIHKGDKIAQMLIAPTPMIEWDEVESLDETSRGEDGFGSTDQ